MPQDRTLVIGLDAACWEYLDPLLQAGRLPNLSRLIEQGVHGTLRSTMPPITPIAWSSLVTGVNPGKHGIIGGWVRRRPDDYRFTPITGDYRVGTPIWRRLNAAGIRVGVVNIPLTYPVQPLDGFLLCGFSTPASARDLTYPSNLLAKLEAQFGPYRPTVEVSTLSDDPEALYTAERDHQWQLVQNAVSLATAHQTQVLFLNLMLLDHANHTMPSMDLVQQAMEDTDADLGWLLDELMPDNVLLISDHGSRRVKGVFLLGAWLAEQGFLTREKLSGLERTRAINHQIRQWLDRYPDMVTRPVRYLLRKGLSNLPAALADPLWHIIEREIPLASMQAQTSDHFVPACTQAYPSRANQGSLQLNLAGREPEGIIPAETSQKVLTQLVAALETVLDPETGDPLFAGIHRAQDLYKGPFVSDAPDLICDHYQSNWSVLSTMPGLRRRPWQYFLPTASYERWYGDHRQDGIFVFAGSAFQNQQEHSLANLLDIPATLLYLYDIPQPDDYDGQPLRHTFIDSSRPLRHQPGDERRRAGSGFTYTEDEEQQVLKRLSQLGYIDA